jgi:Ni,Fe-hydrogenase I large subunit
MTHRSRLTVPGLARVEGEGGFEIVIENGQITEASAAAH